MRITPILLTLCIISCFGCSDHKENVSKEARELRAAVDAITDKDEISDGDIDVLKEAINLSKEHQIYLNSGIVATDALQKIDVKEAVPLLKLAIEHPHPNIWYRGVDGLGELALKSDIAVSALESTVSHENGERSRRALYTLIKLNINTEANLNAALSSEHEEIRRYAENELARRK